MTSGYSSGISASERESAPTSSIATPQPVGAEARQRVQQRVGVGDQRLLGDLDHHGLAAGGDLLGGVAERLGGRVEEERERAGAVEVEAADRGLAQGGVELGDQVGGVGGGEQLLGRFEVAAGLAADERLVADDGAVAQVEDRLVEGPDVGQPQPSERRAGIRARCLLRPHPQSLVLLVRRFLAHVRYVRVWTSRRPRVVRVTTRTRWRPLGSPASLTRTRLRGPRRTFWRFPPT